MTIIARPVFRLATLIALALPIAQAEDLPALRQGNWEYTRTVESSKPPIKLQKCVDPAANMKKQSAAVTKGLCKVTPMVHTGNSYRFSATCTINGVPVVTSSVITVQSDSAYGIDVETQAGGKTSKEHLSAKRLGDC
jgi:hypothetical protein